MVGKILCKLYESDFNATRVFGVQSSILIAFVSTFTTYLPSGVIFTKTLSFPNYLTTSPTYEYGDYKFLCSSLSFLT